MAAQVVRICTFSEKIIEELEEKDRPPGELTDRLKSHFKTDGDGAIYKTLSDVEGILEGEQPGSYGTYKEEIERYAVSALQLSQPLPDKDDFTFYLRKDEITEDVKKLFGMAGPDAEGHSMRSAQGWAVEVVSERVGGGPHESGAPPFNLNVSKLPEGFSYDCDLWLWKSGRALKGRAVVCRSDKGNKWSVTFRKKEEYPKKEKQPNYLNKIEHISEVLEETIFDPPPAEMRGLVVIAGRTGSCKSQIVQRLIETYLKRPASADRRVPHLLTFEDPLEVDFKFEGMEVNQTRREKGKDAADLKEAVGNALRQTPAVMFVGETRNPEEWKLLLEFAGTGHLVVTTAHAGSLTEAMGNILQAMKAEEPAARSVVAERLLALIHLKPDACGDCNLLIPALWHRTPEGVKALMAEGLSSLVPNMPGELGEEQEARFPSSIGRRWFARELLKKAGLGEPTDKIIQMACEWDLQGV
jgi:hypothetical protein